MMPLARIAIILYRCARKIIRKGENESHRWIFQAANITIPLKMSSYGPQKACLQLGFETARSIDGTSDSGRYLNLTQVPGHHHELSDHLMDCEIFSFGASSRFIKILLGEVYGGVTHVPQHRQSAASMAR
jgi:hypothetical protein